MRLVQRSRRPAVLGILAAALLVTLAACGPAGTNSAATPTVPAGAVNNLCSQANAALNPDPSKDLTFVAHDAKGNAIANRSFVVGFYHNDGTYIGIFWGNTDAKGRYTIDVTKYSWLPSTPISAFIAVDGDATTPGLATACGNVDGPGTLTVSTGDAGLATVTLGPTSGGTATTTPYVFPAFTFHGQAREVSSLLAGATGTVRMLQGSYDLGLFTTFNGAAYLLYQPLTLSGSATVAPDVSTVPTAQLHASVQGPAGSQAMTHQGFTLFRADAGLDMHWGATSGLQDMYLTPGKYSVRGYGSLTDSQSVEWQYGFDDPSYFVKGGGMDLTQAGSTVTHVFGGALNASLGSDAASYAAGATVTLTPTIKDPAGDSLEYVTENPGSAATYVGPAVTVKDPNGKVVYTDTLTSNYPATFTLGSSAVTGTYTASFSWDLGPYQSAPLSASTTFQVQ